MLRILLCECEYALNEELGALVENEMLMIFKISENPHMSVTTT